MKNSGTRRSTTTKGRQTRRKTTRARSTAKQKGLYREIWGILLVLSGLLALLGYTSWIGVVGEFFAYIPNQLFGILYGIPTLLVMYVGLGLLLKDPKSKKPILRPSVKWIWYVLLFVSVLSLISFIMQDVTTPVSMLDESYRLSHGGLIGGGIAELLYSVGKRLGGLLINIVAFLIFVSLALRISLGTGIRKVGEKTKGPAKQLGTVVVDKSVQAAQATSDYLSTISLPKTNGKLFDRTKDFSDAEPTQQEDSVGQWMEKNARNTMAEAEILAFDPALAQDVVVDEPVLASPVAAEAPSTISSAATVAASATSAVAPETETDGAPRKMGIGDYDFSRNGFGATEGREGLNFTSYVGQCQAGDTPAEQVESSYDEKLDAYNYSDGTVYRKGYTSFSPETASGHGYAAGYGAAHTEEYVQDDRALAAEETELSTTSAAAPESTSDSNIDSTINPNIDSMEQSWSNAMAEDYGNLRDTDEGGAVDTTASAAPSTAYSADPSAISSTVESTSMTPNESTPQEEGRGGAAAAFGAAVTAASAAPAAVAGLASAAAATAMSAAPSAAVGLASTAATTAMSAVPSAGVGLATSAAATATGAAPLSQGGQFNPVSTEEDTQAVAVNTEGSNVPSGRKGLGLDYHFPSLSILSKGPDSIVNESEVMEKSALLEQTLSSFKINSKVISATRGPAVTRYEMDLPPGVKVSRILNLADNIKLALAAADIRMEAPIPGKSLVGIEVPNSKVSPVHLRDVLDCSDFKNAKGGVPVGLGKDISGKPIITDLTKMPHLLVAGSTGSGKSVCINTLISSILFSRKPDEVKLILIDPKKVELSTYDKVPHLMVPVVTDMKKAASVLRWAVREMESRYRSFADTGCKNIEGYNKQFPDKTFPYIVLIIDELADLMMTAPDDIEDSICRLAQMARAAGIHMVLATQRPSVNVITGTIKANVPSRISFAVATQIDSRTILDMGGAEKLLGKGDMLFNPIGANKPLRIQGAFISDDEVEQLVDFVKVQAAQQFDESAQEALKDEPEPSEEDAKSIRQDEFLEKAVNVAFDYGASTSMLQRRIHVGYSRAGSLIDAMEELKILGPANGSKPRELLMTKEEALALVNRQGN